MALRKCKECGNQVSTNAKACPSCGAPIKKHPTSAASCGGCLLLVVFVFVLIAVMGRSDHPPQGVQTDANIPYEVLKNEKVRSKLVMYLLVNPDASQQEVLKLAENLRREHAGKYATISIFDSREACRAAIAFDQSYPEKELARHWLVVINDTFGEDKISWVAEGRPDAKPAEPKKQ